MQKNMNCWKLMALFFLMAMLYAMGPVQGNPIESQQCDVECFAHSPPAIYIAIMNEEQTNIDVLWISTSMPGVQYGIATITCKVDIPGMQTYSYTRGHDTTGSYQGNSPMTDARARNGTI